MKRDLWEKEWNDLTRKQEKYVQKHSTEKESVLEKLQRFVPNGLQSKLDAAFVKAFQLIFEKGTVVIEKTYPSGGQDVSAAPDPRAMGGGANTQTVGIQPGKTYSVQEWCQIRDEAQAKFQSQKISYKDYAAICDELTKAHREGRVK